MRLSLRWKLALAVGVPVAIGGALTTVVGHYRLKAQALEAMTERAETQATAFAARFDAQLTAIAQVARSTAEFLTAHPDITDDEVYEILSRNVPQHGLIYGSCVAFAPTPARARFAPYVYRPHASTPGGPNAAAALVRMDVTSAYDYTGAQWDWYALPRQTGQPLWTEPFKDEGAGDIVMCTYSAPFFREGRFAGVATVDLPLDRLQQLLNRKQVLEYGKDASFIILSRAGTIISSENQRVIGVTNILDWARAQGRQDLVSISQKMVRGEQGAVVVPGWGDTVSTGKPELGNQLLYYAPIPSTGWSFAAGVTEREIMAPVFARLRQRAVYSLLATTIAIGFAVGLAAWITRPISRLARAVRELSSGNLDARASIDAGDEIGDLARAFNTMVGDLKQRMDDLTRETAARESVESELRVARTIQESLLPHEFPPFPDRLEFNLHALNAPARHMAGDFFDFFMPDENRLVLIIADVSGKGAPAAVFMAVTRTILRDLARNHPDLHPGALLTEANRILLENNTFGMFVTLWFGHFDIRTGAMRYANAGHPHPFLVSSASVVSRFGEVTGPILGILEGASYGEREAGLELGDSIVFYTDGVPEARRPGGAAAAAAANNGAQVNGAANAAPPARGSTDADFFGLARFERLLAAIANTTPTDYNLASRFCTRIVEEIDRFQANERADDITVMTLRRVR